MKMKANEEHFLFFLNYKYNKINNYNLEYKYNNSIEHVIKW